jgi:L-malate glycosyltransferase
VHINNDFSGSSYALKSIIDSHEVGEKVLMTSFSSEGFLTEAKVAHAIDIPYRFKGKSIYTIKAILRNWFKASKAFIRLHRKTPVDIVYLNAISPWHISLLAKLLGIKVIYHVHEFYANPNILIKFYLRWMKHTADKLIYVSEFCKIQYSSLNALKRGIVEEIEYTPIRYLTRMNLDRDVSEKLEGPIILICSPKKYKGVVNFIELALVMPKRKFKLFLSQPYDFQALVPSNVEVIIAKTELQQELCNASLLLNLSQYPDWIETFGLTIWESLSQGTPVIVPDIGGPLEIVNSDCGRIVDVRNKEMVLGAIEEILIDKKRYAVFCEQALSRSNYLETRYPISNP